MSTDVVVIGAGMIGGTLACALADVGLEVALVEPGPVPSPATGGFGLRVSAIGHAARGVLESVGAWSRLPAARLGVFREMRVWERPASEGIHFDAADLGVGELGHIVENAAVLHALEGAIAARGRIEWHRPARIERIEPDADGVEAWLDRGRVRARLLVGADGARSPVRGLAGIGATESPYQQTAVVAVVKTALGHDETAWQRFLADGPVAFLPLPGPLVSIVWSTSPEHARRLIESPPSFFEGELTEAVEGRFGRLELQGEGAGFELARIDAERYVDHRIALVGDAAHAIHPLAGQGANLGLLDAAALAETIERCHAAGRDIGRHANLRAYERWRRGHNALTAQAMDGFKWLFSSPLAPVRVARNLGLGVTDRLDPLKRIIARAACGLSGDLPRRARPAGAAARGPDPA